MTQVAASPSLNSVSIIDESMYSLAIYLANRFYKLKRVVYTVSVYTTCFSFYSAGFDYLRWVIQQQQVHGSIGFFIMPSSRVSSKRGGGGGGGVAGEAPPPPLPPTAQPPPPPPQTDPSSPQDMP